MTSPGTFQNLNTEQDQLKSIVYGDVVKNKYGAFRCFCATVSEESQIQNIVSHLRKNVSFHRLNKFSYAYRISAQIDNEEQIVESYNNDARLEGCGEKILHLLQKFNVENVLLIIGVDKKETYGILSPEYYHTIIERAKDLLSTLYERVLENEIGSGRRDDENMTQRENLKFDGKRTELLPVVTTLNTTNIPEFQAPRKAENRNHFLSSEQRQYLQQTQAQRGHIFPAKEKEKLLQSVLKSNIKRNYDKLKKILEDWTDNDYQHLKFISLYEKTPRVAKVFKMLMILDDIKNPSDLAQNYNYKERLAMLGSSQPNREKCRYVTDILRQDKLLTFKGLEKENHVVASLLEYLSLIVRNQELNDKIYTINLKEEQTERNMFNEFANAQAAADLEDNRHVMGLDITKDTNAAMYKPSYDSMSMQVNVLKTDSEPPVYPQTLLTPQAITNTEMLQSFPDHHISQGNQLSQGNQMIPTNMTNQSMEARLPPSGQKDKSGTKQAIKNTTPSHQNAYGAKNISIASREDKYNVIKHERFKSESNSISEEVTNYMEPRLSNPAGQNDKSKPNKSSASAGKSKYITSDIVSPGKSNPNTGKIDLTFKVQDILHKGGEGESPKITGVMDGGIRVPTSSSKHSGGSKSPATNVYAQRIGTEDQANTIETVPNAFLDNIPDDPEEIKKYLEDHPIEAQSSQALEIIAEKLKKHRVNNY